MQQSIVDYINEQLCELVPGAKVYGIARTAKRDDRILPISGNDWIDYVGVDDTYPFISYHKQQSLSSTIDTRKGFGSSMGDLVNNHGMLLIIFFDEKKLGVKTDELYTLIQARITGILKIDGYKLVQVGVTNAILNDSQVWTQEYGNTQYRLSASQRLIQIGYSVLITLDKNCFPKCISQS